MYLEHRKMMLLQCCLFNIANTYIVNSILQASNVRAFFRGVSYFVGLIMLCLTAGSNMKIRKL